MLLSGRKGGLNASYGTGPKVRAGRAGRKQRITGILKDIHLQKGTLGVQKSILFAHAGPIIQMRTCEWGRQKDMKRIVTRESVTKGKGTMKA